MHNAAGLLLCLLCVRGPEYQAGKMIITPDLSDRLPTACSLGNGPSLRLVQLSHLHGDDLVTDASTGVHPRPQVPVSLLHAGQRFAAGRALLYLFLSAAGSPKHKRQEALCYVVRITIMTDGKSKKL